MKSNQRSALRRERRPRDGAVGAGQWLLLAMADLVPKPIHRAGAGGLAALEYLSKDTIHFCALPARGESLAKMNYHASRMAPIFARDTASRGVVACRSPL